MKKKLFAAVLCALAVAGSALAQATGADAVVEKVEGITSTATTAYVAAAGLGAAALAVGALVYMSRKGWKLK